MTDVVQDDQGLRPPAFNVTDGVEDAATDDSGDELLNEENQKNAADGGQVEVVDEEERLQLEGLAVAHERAATEDDAVVDDDEDGRRLERGHGRLEGDELEVSHGVTRDGGPCLVEYGPQVDAEGAVDGGQRQLLEEGGRGCRRHDGQTEGPESMCRRAKGGSLSEQESRIRDMCLLR